MLTDIEIAQQAEIKPIAEIAKNLNIDNYEPYGKYMAKVKYDNFGNKKGKLILVTAMNPTPLGEGKTTMSIGLADGLRHIGENAVLALREPSLGPVFGIKGGAAGGGYSQVVPMENINLHFTGDIHAIENANNLLAAMIDNHIFQGNALGIKKVTWRRCMDMNDRQLRKIISGYESGNNGVEREDGFDITVASEVMAIFCLATSLENLKERLGNIIIGYNNENKPIFARDLHAEGAMTALLKDAFNPNLVQTLEGTPAFIHGGPFANIAHGCNSLVATKLAMSYGDYVVTEAGFGSDLGAEKFMDIKCLVGDIAPEVIVIVATTKALKYNGGLSKEDCKKPNKEALLKGIENLHRHVSNMLGYGSSVVVVINKYNTDTEEEINLIKNEVFYVPCIVSTSFTDGGKGAEELASVVRFLADNILSVKLNRPYYYKDNIIHKIGCLNLFYGGRDCIYENEALEMIHKIEEMGYDKLPICIAKTQYSFSDDAKLLNAPENFSLHIKEVRLCAGAGFIVAICGKIMTMPGLPKAPAAENITVDENQKIVGLF